MEAASQRKLPGLASIMVEFSDDYSELIVSGRDMPECGSIRLPCDPEAYKSHKLLRVECSNKGRPTGADWSFGFINSRSCGDAADAWLNAYLNAPNSRTKRLNCGKKKTTRYGFARNMGKIDLETVPPVFPLADPKLNPSEYQRRFVGNSKVFHDLSPLLILNRTSATFLGKEIGLGKPYPMSSFRGNIIVQSQKPWDEENWLELHVHTTSGKIVQLHNIKPAPRCVVPCRTPEKTCEYFFPNDKLRLLKFLKKLFPRKSSDPEWGHWNSVFFGVSLEPSLSPCLC